MQAVKAMVVVMGLAIIGIVVFIVLSLVQRTGSGSADNAGFGELALPLPDGCVLAAAELAEGRLVLRLAGPAAAGCQQAVLLDPESGQVLGRVTLTLEP